MLRAWASLFFHIVEMVSTMKLKRWVLPFLLFAAALAMSMQVLAQPQALPLAGRTYVIDSGHGGKDDGAQREGVKEDAINLAIAKEVRAQLTAQGANVIMTREEDYDLADEDVDNRKREDMRRRVEIINCGLADAFISIHLNAYTSANVQGAQVFYQGDQRESEKLAKKIQQRLGQVCQSERSAKAGDYYILEKPSVVGVLVECGFLSNAQEREKLQQEEYQKQLAQAIVEGMIAYEHSRP